MKNTMNIQMNSGRFIMVVWLISANREELEVLVLGEGSISGVEKIKRNEIKEPSYLKLG